MDSRLWIGACSWKYPSWKGLVYSGSTGIDYLAEYSAHFHSVEIDQWFYTLPDPSIAAQYAGATPDDFVFTIKLPNALTLPFLRARKGETDPRPNPDFLSVELFKSVIERLAPLASKTGMLMLQFEYLNKRKMKSREVFLRRLGEFLDGVPRSPPLAIEPRNPGWIDEGYFELLKQKGVSHVFLQGYYMDPVFDLWERYGGLVENAAVIRLHGPDREGMEKLTGGQWDRIAAPKDGDLDKLVGMIHQMRNRGIKVYLNVNNHFEGSAPLTIKRLLERGL
jgi:uncharacterized protein YecE (DUF72 family)